MAKAKRKSGASRFVLKIKTLPDDVKQFATLPDGSPMYVDKFGSVYITRREVVTYRLIQGQA